MQGAIREFFGKIEGIIGWKYIGSAKGAKRERELTEYEDVHWLQHGKKSASQHRLHCGPCGGQRRTMERKLIH